ncbi:hypothetical protein L1887_62982 [Cichorium endivia]|nr:hypothetical protein L1887_62982 [Cichorium endivia]
MFVLVRCPLFQFHALPHASTQAHVAWGAAHAIASLLFAHPAWNPRSRTHALAHTAMPRVLMRFLIARNDDGLLCTRERIMHAARGRRSGLPGELRLLLVEALFALAAGAAFACAAFGMEAGRILAPRGRLRPALAQRRQTGRHLVDRGQLPPAKPPSRYPPCLHRGVQRHSTRRQRHSEAPARLVHLGVLLGRKRPAVFGSRRYAASPAPWAKCKRYTRLHTLHRRHPILPSAARTATALVIHLGAHRGSRSRRVHKGAIALPLVQMRHVVVQHILQLQLGRQQNGAVDRNRQSTVATANHHRTHHQLGQRVEATRQTERIEGSAQTQADGAVGRGELKEAAEDGEPAVGVRVLDVVALDDAHQPQRKAEPPDVERQLAARMRGQKGPPHFRIAGLLRQIARIRRLVAVHPERLFLVHIGAAHGQREWERREVHHDDVQELHRRRERQQAHHREPRGAHGDRLEEPVKDADVELDRLDRRIVDVEDQECQPVDRGEDDEHKRQEPRLARGKEVHEAPTRMVEQKPQRLVHARPLGHAQRHDPDEKAQHDGKARIARQDQERHGDEQKVGVLHERHARVDERHARVGVRRHHVEEPEPRVVGPVRTLLLERRPVLCKRPAVDVRRHDGDHAEVDHEPVGRDEFGEQVERAVLDAAELVPLRLGERVEARVAGDRGVKGQIGGRLGSAVGESTAGAHRGEGGCARHGHGPLKALLDAGHGLLDGQTGDLERRGESSEATAAWPRSGCVPRGRRVRSPCGPRRRIGQ